MCYIPGSTSAYLEAQGPPYLPQEGRPPSGRGKWSRDQHILEKGCVILCKTLEAQLHLTNAFTDRTRRGRSNLPPSTQLSGNCFEPV